MIKINLEKDKKYLLACSYGPDSMALFDILRSNGYDFEIAHVNYGLREEAKEETIQLQAYCEKNGIKCHCYFVDEPISKNIEEKCREIRYKFFKKIIEENRLTGLLVAHNQDDLIETYFLQKYRKGIVETYGLESVSKRENYSIFRPLLAYKKAELQEYCDKNHVPYAIDKTNLEDKFLRNKIRHNIVEKMSNGEREKTVSEIINLNKELYRNHEQIKKNNFMKVEDLLKYDDAELAYHYTFMCRKLIPDYELSLRQVKEFRNIMLSDKPNVMVKLRKGLFFIKSYDRVEVKVLPCATNYAFIIEKPCKFDCEYFALDFTKDSSNRNVKLDDYPITIRNASIKDKFIIKNYEVSMRRAFIDWKMPKELRSRWPIILNNKGEVIYVPRYNANFTPDSTTNFYVK